MHLKQMKSISIYFHLALIIHLFCLLHYTSAGDELRLYTDEDFPEDNQAADTSGGGGEYQLNLHPVQTQTQTQNQQQSFNSPGREQAAQFGQFSQVPQQQQQERQQQQQRQQNQRQSQSNSRAQQPQRNKPSLPSVSSSSSKGGGTAIGLDWSKKLKKYPGQTKSVDPLSLGNFNSQGSTGDDDESALMQWLYPKMTDVEIRKHDEEVKEYERINYQKGIEAELKLRQKEEQKRLAREKEEAAKRAQQQKEQYSKLKSSEENYEKYYHQKLLPQLEQNEREKLLSQQQQSDYPGMEDKKRHHYLNHHHHPNYYAASQEDPASDVEYHKKWYHLGLSGQAKCVNSNAKVMVIAVCIVNIIALVF